MRPSRSVVVVFLAGAALCLVSPCAATVKPQDAPPAGRPADKEEGGLGKLEGSWELTACDYRHTIGYHPDLKVPPGYALLMYAYASLNPKAGSAKRALRWRLAEARLSVEAVPAGDAKGAREEVAEFDYALGTRDKPAALDLTWRPPGFGGLCPDKKGQKVLGVIRVGERLEVALDFSGKKRPASFAPNRTCYRLVFRRVK